MITAFPAHNSNDSPYDEAPMVDSKSGDDAAYVETAAIIQASGNNASSFIDASRKRGAAVKIKS